VSQHLPALQVIVPLLAAPLCLLLRKPSLTRIFAQAVAWTCLAIAGLLLAQVHDGGVISYVFGGWTAPWGIEYRVDVLNAYVLVIVSVIGAVVLLFGPGSAGTRIPPGREHLFHALLLLAMAGLLGIAITGDLFNVFVFLEILSLSSYALIAMGYRRRALTAAYSYLIMGTIAGTFILLGIGLLYQATGTLNMADMVDRLPAALHTRTPILALGLLTVGLCIKLAVFPLHHWLPNAYAEAPSVVSAFLAATATKVSYYVLLRVLFGIFGVAFVFGTLRIDMVLIPLAVVAMFVGSIAAIYQTDLKRVLAFSSVAQVGYMTLGLGFASLNGLTGGLVHLFNHALMKGGLFLVVGCITLSIDSARVQDLKGFGKRHRWIMVAFLIGGLSLVGVPGTVGFISKWYLVLAALEKGWYLVAALIVLSSLLALIYIWRIVELAWFHEPAEGAQMKSVPVHMLVPTWMLIGATVVFGLTTDLTAGVARQAAALLLGVSP